MLGQGRDLASERGVECPGDLPAPSDPDLVERARAAKAALGERVFVLGHHYQRDEVIEFADVTGDSFKLAKEAAARPDAEWVVFCGVHFMAESADILTADTQTVVLPDLAAGCSMADMAAIDQVEECWDELVEAGVADVTVPVTYMNSSAAIKAFTGRHGGTICTSSNAKTALTWAFDRAGDGGKVLFLPDQHLGRNTYARDLGRPLEDCVVWDPHRPMGGLTPEQLRDATMILWRGHCSVHGRFSVEAVEAARREIPGVKVIVHPECRHEVVELADEVGSTEKIIKTIAAAPPGTAWAVGTELNLVQRLAAAVPRAAHRLPREERLLLLDDEPHRPARTWSGRWSRSSTAGSSTRSGSTRRWPRRPGSRSTRCSPCPARPARTERHHAVECGNGGRGDRFRTHGGRCRQPAARGLLLRGRPGPERLGRGLVPEALEPGVGRALHQRVRLQEVVDLAEGERLELGDPAHRVVRAQLAGVVQPHRGDHLGQGVHRVAVVVVHAGRPCPARRAPAGA